MYIKSTNIKICSTFDDAFACDSYVLTGDLLPSSQLQGTQNLYSANIRIAFYMTLLPM